MSDRVTFGTTDQLVLYWGSPRAAADYSSRFNGFPFCTPGLSGDPDNIPEINYRFFGIDEDSISRDEAIKACWRIKKWKVNVDINYHFEGETPETTYDIPYNVEFYPQVGDNLLTDPPNQHSIITRERQLAVSLGFISGDVLDPGGEEEDRATVAVGLFPAFVSAYTDNENMDAGFQNNNYFPWFECSIDSNAVGFFIGTKGNFASSLSLDAVEFDCNLTIEDDHPFTLYLISGQVPDGGSFSGTVNIEPYKYWPYANKAGDPVYDGDTGAQINNPFG